MQLFFQTAYLHLPSPRSPWPADNDTEGGGQEEEEGRRQDRLLCLSRLSHRIDDYLGNHHLNTDDTDTLKTIFKALLRTPLRPLPGAEHPQEAGGGGMPPHHAPGGDMQQPPFCQKYNEQEN